jgi:DNA-binding transcriptional LysR family regulator
MLDVRRLRVLSEVAAQGSFSAAGHALTLTQSAVSQHIAALEREVGQALVERGTRPLQLTDAGYALTRHATGIFARLDGAEQELEEIAGRRHGRLRFGSFPTALGTFVPAAFAHFRERHPEVVLFVIDDHLQRLVPRLEAGELDLALIYEHDSLPDVAARDLVRVPLFEDPFKAVLPEGHRLAGRSKPLALADLAGETWIGGGPASAWYRIVREACAGAGFTPEARFTTDDAVAVQALVAAGLGVAVIPGLPLTRPLDGVAVRPLLPGGPARRISVARPRDAYRGPAVAAMVEALEHAAPP